MTPVSIELLRTVSRIFLDQAYPDGLSTIPAPRGMFAEIPENANVADYLPPDPRTKGIVTVLPAPHPGYAFRLGSAGFPFLRMTLQCVDESDDSLWLCGVDTHDSWRHPDHSDAAMWMSIQAANRDLKAKIEHAWENAGFLTHNVLLRRELQSTRSAES